MAVDQPGDALGVVRTLRHQGMPGREIRDILGAEDPVLVHRYLELHAERLQERLTEQRRALTHVEQVLSRAAAASEAHTFGVASADSGT